MFEGYNWRLIFRRVVLCTALSAIFALARTFHTIEEIKPLSIEVHIIREGLKETPQSEIASQASTYLVPQGAQLRDLWPIFKLQAGDSWYTDEPCSMTITHAMTFVVSCRGEVKKIDRNEKSKAKK